MTEKISRCIAYLLPKRVQYWCVIRVFADASVILKDVCVPEITWAQALDCLKGKFDDK